MFKFSNWAARELIHTLIERSGISTVRPRVRNGNFLRGIRDGSWEFTTLEEGDVKTQVKHVLKTVVDVNPTVDTVASIIKSGISDRGEKER